jgi:hypothetical protein
MLGPSQQVEHQNAPIATSSEDESKSLNNDAKVMFAIMMQLLQK